MAVTFFRALLAALAAIFLLTPVADAQDSRAAEIESASREIASIRSAIADDDIADAQAMESRLRMMRDASRQRLSAIERELETVRAQIDLLGPAPGENDPPESEFVAAERSQFNDQQARLNGERTRVLANIYETGELLARLSGAQVGAFYRSLIERGPSPLLPDILADAGNSFADVSARISRYFAQWAERQRSQDGYGRALLIIIAAFVISLLIFGPVSRWIMRTFSAEIEKRNPTPARRVVVAGLKMAARTAPGVIGGLIIIETLRAQGLLAGEGEAVARAFWTGVLSILLVTGFNAGFFAPSQPVWRIAPIDASQGRIVSGLTLLIVIVFSLKLLLTAIGVSANAEPALIRLIEAIAAIAIGVCVFLLCRKNLWRVENVAPGGAWRITRRIGRAISIVIIASSLLGYVALADFLSTRIVYLAVFIGLAWLLRAILAESALAMRNRLYEDEDPETDEKESLNYRFWSRLIINTVLVIALMPAVLVLFGLPREAVVDLIGQALFGFNIGGVQIPSLAKLFAAVIVFVSVMVVTKLVQRGVQRGPLAHSSVDIGVQNSLITLMGYTGLVIALFASISSLGFDLGNLALIAGALSVGIGFGLQSIVNNFVSGLILLFERPIKVGDWIVTPSGEGTVKKISVRSTEIETFNRSSIIVPNSELISSTVTNWTHKNKIGRVIVNVGVSYSADPEKVRDILLKCAQEHPLVVSHPEPFVTWQDFGSSSLDFDLRAFLNDISKGLAVRTDLRFAIFKALKEAGVEIPFPQQDVYIKSLPDMSGKKEEADDA